jgi:splicing factor 3A subunit 3
MHVATILTNKRVLDTIVFTKLVSNQKTSSEDLLGVFDERFKDLRDYHALHNSSTGTGIGTGTSADAVPIASNKRPRIGNPLADGYDLSSVLTETSKVFSLEEVMGKYLDITLLHTLATSTLRELFESFTNIIDFLQLLSKGLSTGLDEQHKLKERKKYAKWLMQLKEYVEGFLKRAQPLLDIQNVVQEAVADFDKQWNDDETGGVAGWERKYAEKLTNGSVDLSSYVTPDDLLANVGADAIKAELTRLGLKCGGAPLERAKRLFMTKDTPLDQLPAKLFAKGVKPDAESAISNIIVMTGGGDRRIDLARLEFTIAALLDQIRPTLDATIRRAERRQTQTPKERESELQEDLHGSNSADAKLKTDEDEDSDDEAPIYNPKGVPLGWDGKPIPYWLFKLHGLNHFYQCEICGNERYRGRRNFEKHFAEAKHGYGMKCLGIPNTMHFHGVTTIEDAQQLWSKLQGNLEEDQFDGTKQEEYEDSHGNVLTRSTYEDLARQGLL